MSPSVQWRRVRFGHRTRASSHMTAGGIRRVPMSGLVTTFDAVIRAGYRQGGPRADFVPRLALLRRRLPDNPVAAVATHVAASGDLDIDAAEIPSAPTSLDPFVRPSRRAEQSHSR